MGEPIGLRGTIGAMGGRFLKSANVAFLLAALVCSCSGDRDVPDDVRKMCIDSYSRVSEICSTLEGDITVEDAEKRTPIYKRFLACNRNASVAYSKCVDDALAKRARAAQ